MAKIPSKTVLIPVILLLAVLNFSVFASGNGLKVGETAPNPEFIYNNNSPSMELRSSTYLYDYKENKTLLLAIMPDISSKNNYAGVMTSAFDSYFSKGLAFSDIGDWVKYKENLRVLVVSNNDESEIRDYLVKKDLDFDMVSDINMDIANSFGINTWNSSADGSSVYIIDKDNKISYASYDYKGEGEKLRAVQNEIFSQLNIAGLYDGLILNENILFPGDAAIDFEFSYVDNSGSITKGAKLFDYLGKKNVILAFYPAPFSMSCAMELSTFDAYAEKQTLQNISNSELGSDDDVEILMISSSGPDILKKWKNDTKIKNVKLVSDITGDISFAYGSFNPLGYNNRTLFIIDKSGMISYIDWNYVVDEKDFGLVKDHLDQISQK